MTARPTGRDEVVLALLDAGTRLFAARGPDGVSVREIAAEAGVNHGLVHRHFGSKEALLAAVLDREAVRVASSVQELTENPGALLASDSSVDIYWRLLARSILDGRDPRDLQQEFPTMRAMVEQLERAGIESREARMRVGALMAQTLGWLMFESFLIPATGLTGDDPDQLRAEVLARAVSGWSD
jgi:AcrR family transcriptional regulator